MKTKRQNNLKCLKDKNYVIDVIMRNCDAFLKGQVTDYGDLDYMEWCASMKVYLQQLKQHLEQ